MFLLKETEDISTNDDNLYNSKKSNNTKGLIGKQNDNKNKKQGKTLSKIKCPIIVAIQLKKHSSTCGTI